MGKPVMARRGNIYVCPQCGVEYHPWRPTDRVCSTACYTEWRRRSLVDRMWDMVSPEPNSGCWLWTGTVNGKSGYGFTNDGGKHGRDFPAHRAMWEAVNGPIPCGLWVLHRCDVRSCINPAHLFLGNVQDNVDDMISKGRAWFQNPVLLNAQRERMRLRNAERRATSCSCPGSLDERNEHSVACPEFQSPGDGLRDGGRADDAPPIASAQRPPLSSLG